ncbi:MAG: FecR domain-containing protein [Bdellovibrionales bacterium]|nr:FecR domain-containing protein [Ramlibacter sp.]
MRRLLPTFTAALLLSSWLLSSNAQAQAEPSLPYTVQSSDKLIRISREMLTKPGDWNEVARFNKMKDPNFIQPGQRLEIPLRLLKSTPSAAKVISVSGSVQSGGQALAVGAPVPEGTSVQTGADSSAVVQLGDGSQVKLLPNTLAQVVSNRDYALRDASASGSTTWFSGLMRLSQGALETLASKRTNRATPLQIETPTSLVGVRGTRFRVAFDDPASKNARTEVIEGLVRADNTAQQSGADLPAGTGALVKPAEKDIRVVKLLEAPDLSGLPSDVTRPAGNWPLPALAGAAAYRVQVASDAEFNQIVRDLKLDGASAGAPLGTLLVGNWYARVRGIDAQGIEGFDAVKALMVKNPAQWRVSSSSLSLTGGQTVLSLTPVQANGSALSAASYSAEVASDAAMAAIIARPSASEPRLLLGDLKPGVYYVRLRAGNEAPDTDVYRFELPGNWGSTIFDVGFALTKVR